MADNQPVEDAAQRVLKLEEELESAGNAATAGQELQLAHEALHKWVETVVGVVSSPGVGRVTLIHANGNQSKIASPELPYLLSRPATFEKEAEG